MYFFFIIIIFLNKWVGFVYLISLGSIFFRLCFSFSPYIVGLVDNNISTSLKMSFIF